MFCSAIRARTSFLCAHRKWSAPSRSKVVRRGGRSDSQDRGQFGWTGGDFRFVSHRDSSFYGWRWQQGVHHRAGPLLRGSRWKFRRALRTGPGTARMLIAAGHAGGFGRWNGHQWRAQRRTAVVRVMLIRRARERLSLTRRACSLRKRPHPAHHCEYQKRGHGSRAHRQCCC